MIMLAESKPSEKGKNDVSKALTHYIFRNGPIEDIYANGQLSQSNMKVLNKYMVNRIAGILAKISDNQ